MHILKFRYPDLALVFSSVIFYSCYTCPQESLRNSADGMILSSPDLLVVSIAKNHDDGTGQTSGVAISSTHKSYRGFGIDRLDSLKFTYQVCMLVKQHI